MDGRWEERKEGEEEGGRQRVFKGNVCMCVCVEEVKQWVERDAGSVGQCSPNPWSPNKGRSQ